MNDSSGRVIDMNIIESTSTPFGFASRAAMASTAFVVAAFATLLGLLYANVLPDLVYDWWDDPNYSHGFLVPLFSAYLVYQRRASILATELRPSWWGLAPILIGGNVIHLSHISLGVTEACSGIRSLISLLALALAWAALALPGTVTMAIFAIVTIPITIVANAGRVVVTGLIGQWFGRQYAEGFFHMASGWIIFVFAFMCLTMVDRGLRFVMARKRRRP